MPIKNYTTSISEDKTVGEIMGMLAGKGARHVQISYDDRARPDGISFIVHIKMATGDEFGVPVPFKLPCNFQGVFNSLLRNYKDRGARYRFERNPESMAQARRVAWRIIKDWIEAQMALVESEQATLAQVFLPYAVTGNDNGASVTMYQKFIEQVTRTKALPEAVTQES